jgi:Protein of unknown function (DUF4229)
MSTSPDPHPEPGPAPEPGVAAVLMLYGVARVGLLVLIAGLLMLAGTPLVIAVLVALIVALPLSMLLFRGLRSRLDDALAIARARRGAQRAALRAGLRGDREPDGSDPTETPRDPEVAHPPTPAPAHDGEPRSGDRPERQADGGRD